jgi:ribosomal protein S18 acetylase RimI-like enzyme
VKIRPYQVSDEEAVIALWKECGLTRPWNNPQRDIERKLTEQQELFLVGEAHGRVVASAMFGFDGNRGWVHYLGVVPATQRLGYGRMMMQEGERLLQARGCPKVNLQVRASNQEVIAFYQRLGYATEEMVSMGKRLAPIEPRRERESG